MDTRKKIRKAVIPAAGLGTRFLPATKAQPKEMLPIVDKPAIQYIIEEAIQSGIEEILIITGRNKRAIEDHFDRAVELELTLKAQGKYDLLGLVEELSDVTIHYVRQKEAKGLGHAVLCARQFVGNEPFAVLLGDDIIDSPVPCLKQMMDVYADYPGTVLGCQEVPQSRVSSYGIVSPVPVSGAVWKAKDLVEKPAVHEAPSRLAVLGRYIIEPEIFSILETTEPGRGGEIQLTDALRQLARSRAVYAYHFEGRRYDVGDKQGYLEATIEFALKRPDLRDHFLRYLLQNIVPLVSQSEAAASVKQQEESKRL
jgi:UTP--glucose-1-phosphate uridylyltransferase